MKNLITYLKTLWRRGLDSQRKEVGVTLGEATIEHPFSTYSAPFGTCWQPSGKLHSVVRCAAMLVMLFTIGSGNVWGALSSPYTCTFTSGMSMSGSNCTTGDVTWTISTTTGKGSPSITFGNQNGQSCIKFGSGKSNYYSKMTLTTSAFSAYNVSSVVIYASSNNGGSKTFKVTQGATQIGTGSQSFSSTTWVTNITRNTTAGSGGDLSIEISSDATATYVHSIKVTYSAASCTTKPTVGSSLTSVSATVNSITATVPISAIGGCNITENGLVYSTSVATPTVGAANCTKVTTTACGSTAANKTVTISDLPCGTSYYVRGYATNAAGTSYTNVTTQSTSACPTYTVTYNAGTGTCGTAQWTQPSYEASTTLPSATAPATCTGYSFAGWCTSSAGSADENTTSPGTILLSGSSYTPTGDITLYAVYTKTVGGGGSSWVETDFADLTSSDVFVLATPAGYALPSNGGNAKPVVSAITVSAGKITSTVTDGLKWNMSGNSTDGYTFYPNGTTSTWLCCTTTASSGTNDNIRINNSGSRKVWITDSDGDLKTKDTYTDRWLCCYNSADFRGYTASNVTSDIISKCYKYSSGTTYYMTSLVCCTELASINGSFSFTSVGTTGATANWGWTGATTGISKNILKVYKESDNSLVATIDNISASATSQAITGLQPCTEYYVKLSTVSSGSPYCDGVADQAGASHVTFTTSGYTLSVSRDHVNLSSGSEPSNICSNVSATYTAAAGYALPTSITVSNAGAQNTGWTWTSGTGVLTINKANVTGNVTVTITPTCVEPTFGTNLTTGTVNYLTGDAAATLTVGASANGATINYQWQTKVGDGAWTNSGTNASGNTSITPSTAGPGTTSYRCIATNAASGCSATATSNVVTVVVTNPSGYCISAFNSSNNGITGGFSNGGSGNHYTLSYTIPGKDGSSNWPQYWVGENEAWTSSFSASATFADMPLMSNHSATLGLAEGATGTLHIWNDNIQASSNLFIKFEPSGYGLRWGGAGEWNQAANTKAFTVDPGDANVYWTDIVTLDGTNNTTWNYYVGLQTASGYIYSGVDNEASDSRGISRTGSVTAMKVSNGTNGSFKATYLNSEPTNSRGKFRIWINNISAYNFVCHWVPFYRVTYNGNGASGSVAASADVCCEGNAAARTVKAAANEFTAATGKQFAGWATSAGGAKVYDPNDDIVLTADVVLYPVWEDIDYTVTVNQSPSIGATTTGQTSSAHYNGTINLTTTVPSGYRFVNWTTSDGFSITNSTSATTASFTMPAKNVTVTANFQQTHTVDWYVGGSAPANKIGDDGQTTVVDHGGKIEDFPATTPDGSACEKTFVGWTNTSDYVHGTSLLFTDVAGSPAITGATNFYAVFATVSSGAETLLSEDFSEITAGNSTSTSGSSSSWGRNSNFSTGAQTYQAGGAVRLGTGTNTGNLTTKQLTAAIGDEITVAFKVKGWSSVEGDISVSGLYSEFTKPSDITYTAVMDGDFESKSVTVTLTKANPYIIIATTAKRAFIDDLVITKSGTTYTGHTITCADCGTSVTPTFTAAPAGGTVAVTRSGNAVTSGSTVKTCTSQDLSVTITPASHYTLTGFTATGLTTGTATISPTVGSVLPTTSAQTFTVTVSASATGTLNLTPVLTEDAHKVISWVVHGSSASIADGHGTTWVYSGENLTAIPDAPDAPTGCDDKEFVGWSENDGGATEGDASDYTDLFTTLGGAPTGITTNRTFYAVFATPAAGMGGTVIWDEPFDGDAGDQPSSPTSGATVYGSASIAYNCASTTYCKLYTDNLASGGAAAPELLVPKSSRSEAFEVTGIPTAGQTELTLTYMAKDALNVTTGTSGVTVGDASVEGKLYTRTITIDQSGLGVATFGLTFAKSTDSNSRLDDIHLEVPGSSSMSGYVTTCEDTWTVTYYKNTEDAVTNLPSPTGISKSTGSGTLSSKVPVRYGYTFDGWATSAGGSVVYAAGAAVSSVSADMDLYAKWSVTPVTEINLSKTSLDKYVGDPSVTLSVLSVLPDGANTSVTWSSSNSSIATVNSSTGEVNFIAQGTADIIATSTVTNATTATCAVTVWAKPSVSFLDNLHSLTEDKDGNALSGYNLTDVAGTPVVFPILANQSAGSGTCEDEHYVFVGWTTSDNNTDPEDHLVTSHNLTNGDNITYYAVWADGVAGTTYTKLTSSTFKTTPTRYVLGAEYNGTTKYFYSCEKTDKNNSWGYVTADLASNTPIEFTLSGTASALVATSTEVSARYLKPMAEKDFQMSASSQTVELKSDGTIYNPVSTSWKLLYNNANSLRWYDSNISGSANAYFYEVVAGGEVNYRTSCCADKVAAPTVTATKTSTTVTLTWAAVSGATGYELQWNGGAWTAATSGVVKSDLTPNTNYSWRVRATYDPPKCGADIASGNTTTNQVYHVTYAGGSGTGSCNATGSTTDGTAYEAGATVTLQSNGFTLVGHTFNEWTEDDEDITISSNQFTMPEHDVVITATWTPKVDKFYDRMHDGTDASHGGIADGDGKYYITREGCSYTVPSLTDNTSGATACHTKHYVLMGWTAESHLNSDGTLKTGHEGYVYTGGGTQTATGATYYAVWAEVEE